MSRQRLISSALAALLAAGLGLAAAAPASAAYGPCNAHDARETTSVPFSTTNNTNNCYLVQGNTGTGVRMLQTALRGCYGQAITVDGIFGAATRAALVNAQRRMGVTADGAYGPNTHNAMLFQGYGNGNGTPFCAKAVYKA
ncbi:peptidoglycan-binding domain-containing protein [Cellulomonas oligotrophica]|uniref:Peptidoglycan hydrolase-like protein with peptidoglycan-binding domain n=1 Tax=Cellulomonas oligotrophica TaxID=931536 RepID=A0A7Y9FCK5_9CELL|nr:peptidoglycan-binding domain-containing protein [Cellulomonas oligotrophica]NYD84673.1 peptidoglycan hydrolase-like protein with peptidoglycan-binding domain [Cellulomonas oligotrophica]GIG31740.1 hypothetical protein Col01nite_08990 [Cellulomonas oligotrophica]